MGYEELANCMKRIAEGIREDNPSLSGIRHYPGESHAVVQHRADVRKKRTIRQCGSPGPRVMKRTFAESGGCTAQRVPICPQGWEPADVAGDGTQGAVMIEMVIRG